jgi:LysM repeat protein
MNSKLWKIALIAAVHVAVIGSIMVFESCKPKSKTQAGLTPPLGAPPAVAPELTTPPPPAPIATAPVLPPLETKPALASLKTSVYTVAKGDSLSVIARKHGTTVTALKNANKLSSDVIRVGQKLTIPSPQASGQRDAGAPKPRKKVAKAAPKKDAGAAAAPAVEGGYAVEAGDTPEKIAKKLGVKLQALMDANPGIDPKRLQIGQKLNVPGAAPAAIPAGTTPTETAPLPVPMPTVPTPSAPSAEPAPAPGLPGPPPLAPPSAAPSTPPPGPVPGAP